MKDNEYIGILTFTIGVILLATTVVDTMSISVIGFLKLTAATIVIIAGVMLSKDLLKK